MHRVLNVKHRVIRRTGVERAPLATFDIIDLGDGDSKGIKTKNSLSNSKGVKQEDNSSRKDKVVQQLCDAGIQKPETIGGNHSKKALSQASGEGKEDKGADPPTESKDNCHSPGKETKCESNSKTEEKSCVEKEGRTADRNDELSKSPIKECKEDLVLNDAKKSSAPTLTSTNLTRQGTLGRVSIPIKKQSSVSSSSSSEACNDSHFTFTTSRPSIAHLDSAEGGYDLPDSLSHKGSVSNLVPDNIDPKQILSPSKRKAYEKRLERLKVTTSPIARPRSNAPINVVTLDEYANISSPEHSPLPHSVLQDKLKITLPCDEFARGSKINQAKRKDSEDTCFEFSEEILFRCTKSALVVEEDGQLPLSPRRVLIPPTITPTSSPKLSSSPRLSADSSGDNAQSQPAPKLIYMKEDDAAHNFFGLTFDEPENENWADFPDSSSVNVEKADTECSEKEVFSNNTFEKDQSDLQETSLVNQETLEDLHYNIITDTNKDINIDKRQRENNDFSDNVTSHSDVRADSTPENSEILEEFSPSNTSENSSGGLNLEEKLNTKELIIDENIKSLIEKSNLYEETSTLCEKSETKNVNIPIVHAIVKPTTGFNTSKTPDDTVILSSTGEILIDISNSTSQSEEPSSFSEGYSSKTCDKITCQHTHTISTNPFSLHETSADHGEASLDLPIPISSEVLEPSTINIQSDTFSSVSLNPFLQDLSTTSGVLDSSECEDINVEPVARNLESKVSSQEPHPSFIDLNISSAKSSSTSTDLIDFSSSLDLDLPPPQ